MERFFKIVNTYKPLIIFAKHSIVTVWKGSEYPFANTYPWKTILFECSLVISITK